MGPPSFSEPLPPLVGSIIATLLMEKELKASQLNFGLLGY